MKKYSTALLVSLLVFFSCKKINEATDLGGDLIPAIDNINTFEVALNTVTTNSIFNDSTKVGYSDPVALGDINDPEFGRVHANFNFTVSSGIYGSYPFRNPIDSLPGIDSVVLQLSYTGAYGDTLGNGVQTITVNEIDPNSNFKSDSFYRYNDPNSDFGGPQASVGSKTITIRNLRDSLIVFTPGDTATRKVNNVVRIRLNNSIGTRLADFDTTRTSTNAGFYTDSAFKKLFKGFQIKASNSGNALSYFSLSDVAKTKLTVYYRYKKNNVDTSAYVDFTHSSLGQSNYVNVQRGGNWAASVNNTASDKIYLQSAPSGAYASIVIPALPALGNKVVHRAEIIATRLSSTSDNVFTPPGRLFLDRTNAGTPDTVFLFPKDLLTASDGSIGFDAFGGTLKSNQYRFNITRYVQGILTRKESNDTLRLYAPYRTSVFNVNYITSLTPNGGYLSLPVNSRIAEGRVVLAGGNYALDPNARLKLRIIYSNL